MDGERHEVKDPFSRVDDAEDDDFARGFADEDPCHEDDFGCLFPGSCCMPELHFVSECHTAEMAEEMHAYSALSEAREADENPPGTEARPYPDVPPDDGIPF